METYITLANYTGKGVANIKESPQRIDAARKAIDAAGGKMVAWYQVMGRYDMVVITEAPNSKVAASVLLALGAQGNIRTETLRAHTEEEFKEVVSGLP
jgi:uncharacterized protein with GYD domain